MCKSLQICRSSFYYEEVGNKVDIDLENAVIHEFYLSNRIYGSRKLKIQLSIEQNGHKVYRVSRRRIRKIMKKYSLVSKYTLKRGKKKASPVNNDSIPNEVNRQFSNRKPLEVVVSDLLQQVQYQRHV